MAVGFRDKVAVNSTGATTSITIPATVQAGDLLILYAVGAYQPSAPAGWGTYWTTSQGSTYQQAMLSSRVAVAGDAGATITISWANNAGQYQSAAILAFSGAGRIRQFSLVNGTIGQNGNQTPPAISINANSAVAYFGSARDTSVAPALTRGTTDVTLSSADGTERIVVGHELFPGGTTGLTQTFTAPASGNGYVDMVVEVAPANSAAANYDSTVLADSPLLYWKLDEPAGQFNLGVYTGIADASPNNHYGSHQGTGTFNLSQPSQIIGSDAGMTSNGTAELRSTSFAWPAGTITVEFWLQVVSPGTGSYMPISWGVNYADIMIGNNLIGVNNGGGPQAGAAMPSLGVHHIVFVLTQGSVTSSANTKVYVDGILQTYASNGSLTMPSLGTTYLQVSGWTSSGQLLPSGTYVDSVAAYAGELSAARVAAHFSAGNNAFTDAFASARALGAPYSIAFDASSYTTEASEPLTMPTGATGWATFTPTVSGTYQLDTIGSAYDTGLAVYTGSTLAGLTLVASDDSSGGSSNAKLTLHLAAGTTYYVQVGNGGGVSITPSTLKFNLAANTWDGAVPSRGDQAGSETTLTGWLYKGRSTRTADTGSVA